MFGFSTFSEASFSALPDAGSPGGSTFTLAAFTLSSAGAQAIPGAGFTENGALTAASTSPSD